MSYRCINAFSFGDRVVAGGASVADDDPILKTHGAHFVKVAEPVAVRTETASAAPKEVRTPEPEPAAVADVEPAEIKRRPGRPRKESHE